MGVMFRVEVAWFVVRVREQGSGPRISDLGYGVLLERILQSRNRPHCSC